MLKDRGVCERTHGKMNPLLEHPGPFSLPAIVIAPASHPTSAAVDASNPGSNTALDPALDPIADPLTNPLSKASSQASSKVVPSSDPAPSASPSPASQSVRLGGSEIRSASLRAVPCSERPRERLIQNGPESLQTAELLGLLLRTGVPGANAVAIGESLHRHFGSLATMNRASHGELARFRGVGPGKAAILMAALELGRRVSRESLNNAPLLDTPSRIAALLADTAAGWNAERMVVLLLNTRCRLIRMETVTEGLIDQVLVHPREIFRPAIAAGAHSIVLVHNHPSGDPSPSEADIRITREILRAGLILRIEVLDHVILGRPSDHWVKGYSSLRELGHFRPT